MSLNSAPARQAIAAPSAVATSGFVVLAKSIPAPPVASSTARAVTASVCSVLMQNLDSHDASILQQQVASESKLAKINIAELLGVLKKCAPNLASGGVAVGVQHAVARVRALRA